MSNLLRQGIDELHSVPEGKIHSRSRTVKRSTITWERLADQLTLGTQSLNVAVPFTLALEPDGSSSNFDRSVKLGETGRVVKATRGA